MQPPLLQDFGYLGIGHHNVEAVMHGDYHIPPGVDQYMARFSEHLCMEPTMANAPPIQMYFMIDEWKSGWKKAKERTVTGSDFTDISKQAAPMTSLPILNPLWPIYHFSVATLQNNGRRQLIVCY
jgi:hypothetical protein